MGASSDARKTSPAWFVLESMESMVRTVKTVLAGTVMVFGCGGGGGAGDAAGGAFCALSTGAGAGVCVSEGAGVVGTDCVDSDRAARCLWRGSGLAGSGAAGGFSA